jgi:hypothetical protein
VGPAGRGGRRARGQGAPSQRRSGDRGDGQCARRPVAHPRRAGLHAWNWCWFGRAAHAIGELDEARAAYERAMELETEGDEETDTAELLEALE